MKLFKRIVSRETVEDQHRGSTRLGPGVWVDRTGGMHYSIPELLAHFGEADTPENREQMATIITRVAKEAGVAEVIEQEERLN